MEEIKVKIAEMIKEALNIDISIEEIFSKIETPKDKKNGDFAYPCFNLAKVLKNSPVNIANELKEKIKLNSNIKKIEVVNGYLNFYVNDLDISRKVLSNIYSKKENYGFQNIGKNQNVCLDYSSPNIAKPFHLGHLRTTIIGRAISNLYKELGYNTISINYLGDWGRQFGLVIEGYKRFKDEYDISKDPLHSLSDMYVRANNLAKEDDPKLCVRHTLRGDVHGSRDTLHLFVMLRLLPAARTSESFLIVYA